MSEIVHVTHAVSTTEMIGRIHAFEEWMIGHPMVTLQIHGVSPLLSFTLYDRENVLISVSGLTLYACIDYVMDLERVKELRA